MYLYFSTGKTYCSGCKKKCSGEVLKIKGDKFFHIECFKCTSKLATCYYLLITNIDYYFIT